MRIYGLMFRLVYRYFIGGVLYVRDILQRSDFMDHPVVETILKNATTKKLLKSSSQVARIIPTTRSRVNSITKPYSQKQYGKINMGQMY